MKLSRREEKALALARRANEGRKRAAEGIARQADRVMGFGVAVGAAAGMSYYMARYSADKPEWMGFPKEVWIGLGLLFVGLYLGSRKGKSAQASAQLALSAATGIASGYAAAWGDTKGEEARLKAAG